MHTVSKQRNNPDALFHFWGKSGSFIVTPRNNGCDARSTAGMTEEKRLAMGLREEMVQVGFVGAWCKAIDFRRC